MRKLRFAIVIFSVLALALASSYADAQKLKKQMVGIWTVVSATREVDGKNTGDLYGPNPVGQFIFTRDDHFSLFIFRQNRPKFVSNDSKAGTSEEYKETMTGFISEFGTYTINPDGTSVTLHIVACSYPNWSATHPRRNIQIAGDEMKVGVPPSSSGSGGAVITIRRVK